MAIVHVPLHLCRLQVVAWLVSKWPESLTPAEHASLLSTLAQMLRENKRWVMSVWLVWLITMHMLCSAWDTPHTWTMAGSTIVEGRNWLFCYSMGLLAAYSCVFMIVMIIGCLFVYRVACVRWVLVCLHALALHPSTLHLCTSHPSTNHSPISHLPANHPSTSRISSLGTTASQLSLCSNHLSLSNSHPSLSSSHPSFSSVSETREQLWQRIWNSTIK